MPQLALCAIGRDRPGVVAEVTQALLAHRVNIEDAQAAVLSGHFAFVFVLAAPPGTDVAVIRASLEDVAARVELEGLLLTEMEPDQPEPPVATHVITVYGVDHPGIVHAISRSLAEQEISIVELRTQVAGEEDEALYVMLLDVAGAPDLEALDALAAGEGVEVSVRELEDTQP
ncbi:MAG: glycine cleavage system transcriptional repressor [Solirubrobacterales bacterium]|jgi:glycine cleavage system transcriptional repressor|nr:glycine cleavage system transcriptional repressor [Solirubrobacterales bacterium]